VERESRKAQTSAATLSRTRTRKCLDLQYFLYFFLLTISANERNTLVMALPAKKLEVNQPMTKNNDTSKSLNAPPELAGVYLILQSLESRVAALATEMRRAFFWLLSGGISGCVVLLSAFITGYLILDKRISELDTKFATESKDLRASFSASSDRIYDKLLELNASVARLDARVAPGAAANSPVQKPTKTPADAPGP
jgi:hypothetical protein